MATDMEKVVKLIDDVGKRVDKKIDRIPKYDMAEISSQIQNNRILLIKISSKLNEISGMIESISTQETQAGTTESLTVAEFEE